MPGVTLSADGSLVVEGRLASDPLGCLGRKAVMGQGATLRSFFAMLERYPALKGLSEFLPGACQEAGAAPRLGCATDLFECIEIGRTVEMIGFPGEPRLEIFTTLKGAGGGRLHDLRYMAVEALLDMELKLGRLRHVVLGDEAATLDFVTTFNLFEIIEGVAWELGFHTAPKQCTIRG